MVVDNDVIRVLIVGGVEDKGEQQQEKSLLVSLDNYVGINNDAVTSGAHHSFSISHYYFFFSQLVMSKG